MMLQLNSLPFLQPLGEHQAHALLTMAIPTMAVLTTPVPTMAMLTTAGLTMAGLTMAIPTTPCTYYGDAYHACTSSLHQARGVCAQDVMHTQVLALSRECTYLDAYALLQRGGCGDELPVVESQAPAIYHPTTTTTPAMYHPRVPRGGLTGFRYSATCPSPRYISPPVLPGVESQARYLPPTPR